MINVSTDNDEVTIKMSKAEAQLLAGFTKAFCDTGPEEEPDTLHDFFKELTEKLSDD